MSVTRHPRQVLLLATVFLLNATEFLQAGMMAFGAEAIMGQINASPEEYTFVTIIYAAVAIGAIACQHWLIERLGWRQFIRVSVALFVAGAALCAGSDTFVQFLVGRAVMGLGGAAFMTSARLLINLIPPSPERFKGIVAFATSLAIGNACAPWVTAAAVTHDAWWAIFVLLGALAVVAALLGSLCLPTELTPDTQRSHASPPLVAAIVGFSLLCLYALQRAAYDFYSEGLPLLACVLAGVGGLVLLTRHQHAHARPLLALKRLVQLRYLSGLGLFFLCYVVLGANNTMLPVLMQRALGFPWEVIGKVLTLGMLSSLVAFVVKARIMLTAPAPRKFYVAGFTALFYSGWQLSRLNPEASLWTDVLPAIAGFGVFVILALATTALQTFTGLQHDALAFAHGQMLKNMMSQFGIALGIAAATLALQWRTSEHIFQLSQHLQPGDPETTNLLEQMASNFSASHGPQQAAQLALVQLTQLLNQQATLLAGIEYFSVVMMLALVGAVTMALQRVFR